MIRILTALPLLGLPGLAQDVGPHGRMLTDFASGGLPLQWYSVNDSVMGGRSAGSFRVADGVLAFAGSLNTNGGGFASIRTQTATLELGTAEGIHLRVRGDGREYTMRLRQRGATGRRSVSYRATFTTRKGGAWQDVWLPFRTFVATWRGRTLDLPPVEPERIDSIGLMIADKIDGAFRLEVDSIRAYPPFSLDSYRWHHRALLVFACNAEDEQLKKQLAAAQSAEEGLRDRDVVLFVLLDEGTSRAGTRPLLRADAAKLRQRFGVAPESFAVKLLGKDGGVKRSVGAPLDLSAAYAQIDAMPMRRAEVGARQRESGSSG